MKNFILLIAFLFSQVALGQNLKLPQLNPILNSQIASNDLTVVSDITANESKKLSFAEMDKRWQWTATTPLLKTGSESSVLSIPAATASVHGYLSSGDWTLFNAKQATVSASSPLIFSANNMSIPAATASVHGYLSSSDWTTFNAKVGTSTTDVLTNKDIDGGTASNARRITLPKDTKTNLDALTRKQGTIVYDTTSNKPYYDNGTILTAVGSGSGGGKNYITGGDAESGTTGFATYADAAGANPVDGTGGSPSVTWTTTATSPLESANSFLLTKGATNRQGDGASYAFTIDAQNQAKVLTVDFYYLVNSGTFVAGTSSTASDVTIWIYDVTNSQLIQPSSYKLLSNSTTIADKFSATFQTASNSTSYRLIFHVGSTSASAYTLKIDDIKVSPSVYVFGTPVTDYSDLSGITGSWVTNATYTGKMKKVGDVAKFVYKVSLAGLPTATGLIINLPVTIDDTKLLTTSAAKSYFGEVRIADATGAGRIKGSVGRNSATSIAVYYQDNSSTANSNTEVNVNATSPITFASGDEINIEFEVPILGWSSSVQMSDQTDPRVVTFAKNYVTPTGTLGGSYNTVIFGGTPEIDRTGTYNPATGEYTVTIPGDYRVSAELEIRGTYSVGNGTMAVVAVNGTAQTYGAEVAAAAGTYPLATKVDGIVNVKSGDKITIQSYATGSGHTYTNSYAGSHLFINRISGATTTAATDSMAASYQTAAGQAIAGATISIVDYGTKMNDTHGSVTTGASWKFQPYISGRFRVCAYTKYASASWTNTSYMRLGLYKTGSLYRYLQDMVLPATGTYSPPMVGGCSQVRLLATDYIDVRTSQNEGARSLVATAEDNYIDIERIGNY